MLLAAPQVTAAAAPAVWERFDPPHDTTSNLTVQQLVAFGRNDAVLHGVTRAPWCDDCVNRHLWRFDGQRWNTLALPGALLGGTLTGTAPDDYWLFGTDAQVRFHGYHWDGRAWTDLSPSPTLFQPGNAHAFTRDDVWAVGDDRTGGGFRAAIAHYDGTSWSTVLAPDASTSAVTLTTVRAFAANDVWVGGYVGALTGTPQPYLAHWNGTGWSRVAAPTFTPGALVTSLASHGGVVWAAGSTRGSAKQSFALRRSGTGWTTTTLPGPASESPSLAVVDGELWAGMRPTTPPPAATGCDTCLARWTGTAWESMAQPLAGTTSARVFSIPGGGAWVAGGIRNWADYTTYLVRQ
nr:hypothetical protein [uncultured bacterium]